MAAKSISTADFSINTNTPKVAFWVLAYLVHDSGLATTIRHETAPALQVKENWTNTEFLRSSCPNLDALFSECLRLCSASSSIRVTKTAAVRGGKTFPKGARIVTPFRQLHFEEAVYGEDPSMFSPRRFLVNKTLSRSGHYRPFGGGVSYCPGRFIARQEVSAFVAFILQRFEIELDDHHQFPDIDAKRPTTGLMSPMEGQDVRVRLIPVSQLAEKLV